MITRVMLTSAPSKRGIVGLVAYRKNCVREPLPGYVAELFCDIMALLSHKDML